MKLWIDITTPTAHYQRVHWLEGVPLPSVGDTVLLGKDEGAWAFQVLERFLGIGTDPQTGRPATQVLLTVDSEPPLGFHV